MFKAILSIFLLGLSLHVHAQINPFRPGAIPLAVRTPYVNSWLLGGTQGPTLGHDWSKLAHNQVTGWGGYVRVDGVNYRTMGAFALINGTIEATQIGLTITPTQTNFVLKTGPVNTRINFLSPIETDYVKMSLPFTYVAVSFESNDGQTHDVQVYFDMSGEWISGNVGKDIMNWATMPNNGNTIIYHDFGLQTPQQYVETDGRIEYGRAYHATTLAQGVTYATCSDQACRSMFATNGKLDGSADINFREVNNNWPVMALSVALGSITQTKQPLVFALGHSRDPVVEYQRTNDAPESRFLFFHTLFDKIEDALAWFIQDYPNALQAAQTFDGKLQAAAATYGTDYYSVLALATRQVMAQAELTVGKHADGTFNRDDTLMFMYGPRTSAIEELYASAPFWLYLNPELLRMLLQPIINEHIRKGISSASQTGAFMDLGSSYPRVTGHQSGDSMPIEATGDLLIMTIAYVRASGNASIILDNYQLFDGFAQFLKSNTQNPTKQSSADSVYLGVLTGDTNLAIKGIIALKAYGDLVTALGKPEGADYTASGNTFAQSWQKQALVSGGGEYRLAFTVDDNMWGSEYNVFADKWLGANVLPADVFTRLSSSYQNRTQSFGVPIDARNVYGKPEWTMFSAGLVPDAPTRNILITSLVTYLSKGSCTAPWCDLYQVNGGSFSPTFVNRPVVGGVYSLLARDLPVMPLGATANQKSSAIGLPTPVHLLLTFTLLAIFNLL